MANPKGKGIYGEVKRLPIPAVSRYGVNNSTHQAFERLKKQVMQEAGITFKRKDFRPTGGQLALDEGVPIEGISVDEACVYENDGAVLLPRPS